MRKKLKEIMDKEEGFTLVELLAVIVIIGIIMAIAVPAIGSVINKSQGQADVAEIELIKDAAKLYHISEKGVKADETTEIVTVATLVSKGYLEEVKSKNKNGSVTITIVGATATTPAKTTYEFSPGT